MTVVADELGLCDEVLGFAAQYAERHHVTLEIARTWAALHRDGPPDAAALADEHAQIDADLSDLRRAHPRVAITSRIELGDTWLDRVRAHSSLVVVGRSTAARLGITAPLPDPLCPVAFIPDRWLDRSV